VVGSICGAKFFHANSQSDKDKTHLKTSLGEVTITHPAHPLCGQTFKVLQRSKEAILIQLPSGEQRFIAISWTDQSVSPLSMAGAKFLPDQLVNMRQQVDTLWQKKLTTGTIPPQRQEQLGGEHGKPHSIHAGAVDPGRTSPGDRDFSANDLATIEQDSRGAKQ
jgi:hypothetical protein